MAELGATLAHHYWLAPFRFTLSHRLGSQKRYSASPPSTKRRPLATDQVFVVVDNWTAGQWRFTACFIAHYHAAQSVASDRILHQPHLTETDSAMAFACRDAMMRIPATADGSDRLVAEEPCREMAGDSLPGC